MEDLASLVERARREFGESGDAAALENAKARFLGKSGALNAFRPSGGTPEERKAQGIEHPNLEPTRRERGAEAF